MYLQDGRSLCQNLLNLYCDYLDKKSNLKDKENTRTRRRRKGEIDPLTWGESRPEIELIQNPSSFTIYAEVRSRVLSYLNQASQDILHCLGEGADSDSDSEGDECFFVPKVVCLGLVSVFELIKGLVEVCPPLCYKALLALLDILQGQRPEGLSKEDPAVLDSLFDLLLRLAEPEFDNIITNDLSGVACSCLLALVVARGNTGKLFRAVTDLLTGSRVNQEIRVSSVVRELERSVRLSQSKDLEAESQTECLEVKNDDLSFYKFGIEKNSVVDKFCVQSLIENSQFSTNLTSDGSYLYLKNHLGLYKIGTGFSNTKRGTVYVKNSNFYPNTSGWLGFVQDTLFFFIFKSSELISIDEESLDILESVPIHDVDNNTGVIFNNDVCIGLMYSDSTEGYVLKLFNPKTNPVSLASQVNLSLSQKRLKILGSLEHHTTVPFTLQEDVVKAVSGRDFTLILTSTGKVYSKSTGGKECQRSDSKYDWTELNLDKGGKVSTLSVGHDGLHAVLVSDDGVPYFYGTSRRGEDGETGKVRKQPKITKPKRITRMDGYFIVNAACNSGTTALVTRDGELYMFGKDTQACDQTGLVVDLKDIFVKNVAMGKAHVLVLTDKFHVYTFGLNNKGQCGRNGKNDFSEDKNVSMDNNLKEEKNQVAATKDKRGFKTLKPDSDYLKYRESKYKRTQQRRSDSDSDNVVTYFGNSKADIPLFKSDSVTDKYNIPSLDTSDSILSASTPKLKVSRLEFCDFGENIPGEAMDEIEMRRDQDEPSLGEAEDDGLESGEDFVMCPPGAHRFQQDNCMICTICRECTGYGSLCVSGGKGNQKPFTACGCGAGDSGCSACGCCRSCANEIDGAADVYLPPSNVPVIEYPVVEANHRFADIANGFLDRPGEPPFKISSRKEHHPYEEVDKSYIKRLSPGQVHLPAAAASPTRVQLPTGSPGRVFLPTSSPVIQIACGLHHCIVLCSNGSVYTWGGNSHGQLGTGDLSYRGTPLLVVASVDDHGKQESRKSYFKDSNRPEEISDYISSGSEKNHSNFHLQADTQSSNAKDSRYKKIQGISAGSTHSVLLTDSGQVFTFGSYASGQLGRMDGISGNTNEVKWQSLWYSTPAPIPGISIRNGQKAAWIGASGDSTFINLDVELIKKRDFRNCRIVANQNCLIILPKLSISSEITIDQELSRSNNSLDSESLNALKEKTEKFTCLIIKIEDNDTHNHNSSVNGDKKFSCCKFSSANQFDFSHEVVCLDYFYDVIWTYDQKQTFKCFNPVSSRSVRIPDPLFTRGNLRDSFSPGLSIPVDSQLEIPRVQVALHLLSNIDTLNYLNSNFSKEIKENISIDSSRRSKFKKLQQNLSSVSARKKIPESLDSPSQKDDYIALNRFEGHGGGWGYSGHSIEAIRFMCDSDVAIAGFGLFGGRGEYLAKLKLFDLGVEGGDHEIEGELLSETEEIVFECAPRQKFPILLQEPISVHANRWYVAWARIGGPSSDCGSAGQSIVTLENVTFYFKSSKKSNNGTDVNAGQIAQILFRPTCPETLSLSQNIETPDIAILSRNFYLNPSLEVFQSLLDLLKFSWSNFCDISENFGVDPGIADRTNNLANDSEFDCKNFQSVNEVPEKLLVKSNTLIGSSAVKNVPRSNSVAIETTSKRENLGLTSVQSISQKLSQNISSVSKSLKSKEAEFIARITGITGQSSSQPHHGIPERATEIKNQGIDNAGFHSHKILNHKNSEKSGIYYSDVNNKRNSLKKGSTYKVELSIEQLTFTCCACLRLLRTYINHIYPNCIKSLKKTEENEGVVELIVSVRSLVRTMLSKPVKERNLLAKRNVHIKAVGSKGKKSNIGDKANKSGQNYTENAHLIEKNNYLKEILFECKMTFVECFHAFYPTGQAKWACLCELLVNMESLSTFNCHNNQDFYMDQLLCSVLVSLYNPTVKLLQTFPVLNAENHYLFYKDRFDPVPSDRTYEDSSEPGPSSESQQPSPSDNAFLSTFQQGDLNFYPILVEKMSTKNQTCNSINAWTFREVLDRLLGILSSEIRQVLRGDKNSHKTERDTFFPPDHYEKENSFFNSNQSEDFGKFSKSREDILKYSLSENICLIISAVVAELVHQTKSKQVKNIDSDRIMYITPPRFPRTAQNRTWSSGNGTPDAICFTVDKPGVSIAGIIAYTGSGTYDYEVDLLSSVEFEGSSKKPGIQNEREKWHILESTKGTFTLDESVNVNTDQGSTMQIKFEKLVPIKEGVRYAIQLINRGARTNNGDGGIATVRGPDGTTFTFGACSLSVNGTSPIRGQVPQILYCSNREEQQEPQRSLSLNQIKNCAITICGSVFRVSTDLLSIALGIGDSKALAALQESSLINLLLPLLMAHMGPIATSDARSSVALISLIQDVLPHVSALNNLTLANKKTLSSKSFDSGVTSSHENKYNSLNESSGVTTSHENKYNSFNESSRVTASLDKYSSHNESSKSSHSISKVTNTLKSYSCDLKDCSTSKLFNQNNNLKKHSKDKEISTKSVEFSSENIKRAVSRAKSVGFTPENVVFTPENVDSKMASEGFNEFMQTTTSHHHAWVESEHPYKASIVSNQRIKFPAPVHWISLEFDARCATAQLEDVLQIYIIKDDRNIPVFNRFFVNKNWPVNTVVLPGRELIFSFETSSDYLKDDSADRYGYRVLVSGYEWPVKTGFEPGRGFENVIANGFEPGRGLENVIANGLEPLSHLEQELAYMGGLCAAAIIHKDVKLISGNEEELLESIQDWRTADAIKECFDTHNELLSRGFAISNPPNIQQTLDGVIPFSCDSNERLFLRDFVSCISGTSGGRMAEWLQPESWVDVRNCDVLYSKDDMRAGWPAIVTVVTRDQYGNVVMAPRIEVEVSAVPILIGAEERKSSKRLSRRLSIEKDHMTYGGHPHPVLDTPYQATVKDKMAYVSISVMKAYENYSFEELRLCSPTIHRSTETMLVRSNNDGTYSSNWTPTCVGWYSLKATIDGYPLDKIYKLEIKEAPKGLLTSMQKTTRSSSEKSYRLRKFNVRCSAGLRIRSHPSLQSEQIGVVKFDETIAFEYEVHNSDGVWLKLSPESIRQYCTGTDQFFSDTASLESQEAWCLQYNQHLGKTLLVSVEEPKTILDQVITDTISRRHSSPGRFKKSVDSPRLFTLVKCGVSGHNIRSTPSLKSPPVGILALGNEITVQAELKNNDGLWVRLSNESVRKYCFRESEAWSLAVSRGRTLYLQASVSDMAAKLAEKSSESDEKLGEAHSGFDFSDFNKTTDLKSFNKPISQKPFEFGQQEISNSNSGRLKEEIYSDTLSNGTPYHPTSTDRLVSVLDGGSELLDGNDLASGVGDGSAPVSNGLSETGQGEISSSDIEGMSVKERIKSIGQSRFNRSAHIVQTPPPTPKHVSRPSTPKASREGTSKERSRSIPGATHEISRLVSDEDQCLRVEVVSDAKSGTTKYSHASFTVRHKNKTRNSQDVPEKIMTQSATQTSPEEVKFSLGSTTINDEFSGSRQSKISPRSSPKSPRKDRNAGKKLRQKRDRPVSPGTLARERPVFRKNPADIKKALSPSVAECLRAVFAAVLWHENVVHDAMACSSYLKFHPNLHKADISWKPLISGAKPPEARLKLTKEQKARQRHSVEVSAYSYLNVLLSNCDEISRFNASSINLDSLNEQQINSLNANDDGNAAIPTLPNDSNKIPTQIRPIKNKSPSSSFKITDLASTTPSPPDRTKIASPKPQIPVKPRLGSSPPSPQPCKVNSSPTNLQKGKSYTSPKSSPSLKSASAGLGQPPGSQISKLATVIEVPLVAEKNEKNKDLRFPKFKILSQVDEVLDVKTKSFDSKETGGILGLDSETTGGILSSKVSEFQSHEFPLVLKHIVFLWEELASSLIVAMEQNLILPSPNLYPEKVKGEKKKARKKSRPESEVEDEARLICELCNELVSSLNNEKHFAEFHPGCFKSAHGCGYMNMKWKFQASKDRLEIPCGDISKNCYHMCWNCRKSYKSKYQSTQYQRSTVTKNQVLKRSNLRASALLTPGIEAHLIIRNNAMFLLDLANDSTSLKSHSRGLKSYHNFLSSLPQNYPELNLFPKVDFQCIHTLNCQQQRISQLREEHLHDHLVQNAFDQPFRQGASSRPSSSSHRSDGSNGTTSEATLKDSFSSGHSHQASPASDPESNLKPFHRSLSITGSGQEWTTTSDTVPSGSILKPDSTLHGPYVQYGHGVETTFYRRRNNSTSERRGVSGAAGMGSLLARPSPALEKLVSELNTSFNAENSNKREEGPKISRKLPQIPGSCAMDSSSQASLNEKAKSNVVYRRKYQEMKSSDHQSTETNVSERLFKLAQRPSVSFVLQSRDLESLAYTMRHATRKAAARVYGMQALNWLIRSVTQPTCLHDLLWCFVMALSPGSVFATQIERQSRRNHNEFDNEINILDDPLMDVAPAGGATYPLPQAFHQLLQTIADLMMLLPGGSPLQVMAVRCWSLKFSPKDHNFLHQCHVFSNISKILSKSEEILSGIDESFPLSTCTVKNYVDITRNCEVKTSSRMAMVSSLTDGTTETFWESGDEDRNKTKVIFISGKIGAECDLQSSTNAKKIDVEKSPIKPKIIYIHIDNCRDLANKVSSMALKLGSSLDDLKNIKEVTVESRYSGWLHFYLPEFSGSIFFIGLELKGPDPSVRVRQVSVLGISTTEDIVLDKITTLQISLIHHYRICEQETLKVFRLLTSQVFGKLLRIPNVGTSLKLGELDKSSQSRNKKIGPEKTDFDYNKDLREHMVGILFSRSKLSQLQKQICSHIVQAVRKESKRSREEWENSVKSLSQKVPKENTSILDPKKAELETAVGAGRSLSDDYCFEMLSMLLALTGSTVGRAYLANQSNLLRQLLSFLHTGSARVQRQVLSLILRILLDLPAYKLSEITNSQLPKLNLLELPTGSIYLKENSGVLDIFLAVIAKSLTVQIKNKFVNSNQCEKKKVRGSGAEPHQSFLSSCINIWVSKDLADKEWWLNGEPNHNLASKIINLIRDMTKGNFGEDWSRVSKSAIAEKILALIQLGEEQHEKYSCGSSEASLVNYEEYIQSCLSRPTLWFALSCLCVIHDDHVDILSRNQWEISDQNPSRDQPISGQNVITSADLTKNGTITAEKKILEIERPMCENHDDDVTMANVTCDRCGKLCFECDRILHLSKKSKNHSRSIFKHHRKTIKVDFHEGCGRIKLFWLLAVTDSNTLKSMLEFKREGSQNIVPSNFVDGENSAILRGLGGTCRFCSGPVSDSKSIFGSQIQVCENSDCQELGSEACTRVLNCGHLCWGVKAETNCLPCLHGCDSQSNLKQDADDMCMICFSDPLGSAPCIQLECFHIFHSQCCRRILSNKWPGPRITFTFSLCPICKIPINHWSLTDLLTPINALFDDVRRKALMRLEYEGLSGAESLQGDAVSYAMKRYAYYVCFKCSKAYFGGEVRCEFEADIHSDFDPTELVCGGCSDVAMAQMCPKHGTDFLEYKCRYCCSVAVFFCFGTTHFCNPCHENFQSVTNIPKNQLPHCPAGPRMEQLVGDECPLHIEHPPTGEEFALGCGVCRNAHTF